MQSSDTLSKPLTSLTSTSAAMQALKIGAGSSLRHVSRRGYATVADATGSKSYAQTNMNLRITSETKLIYQGFTGRQGT